MPADEILQTEVNEFELLYPRDQDWQTVLEIYQRSFLQLHPENYSSRSPRRRHLAEKVRTFDVTGFYDAVQKNPGDPRVLLTNDQAGGREAVAFVMAITQHAKSGPDVTLELKTFAVEPRLWGKGLGRKMIELLLAKKPIQVARLKMLVSAHDLRTQLFLRGCGFCWQRTGFNPDGEEFFRMVRTQKNKSARRSGQV